MARKKKVESITTQMDSMLSYFEIEQGSDRDEKMTKTNLKKFLKKISDSYERQVVEDFVRKLKDKMDEDMNNEIGMDDDDDPFMDMDMDNSFEEKKAPNIFDNPPDGDFNPEIERFLAWLSAVLYSGDHKIEISTNGNKTNILLIKLGKNGRK